MFILSYQENVRTDEFNMFNIGLECFLEDAIKIASLFLYENLQESRPFILIKSDKLVEVCCRKYKASVLIENFDICSTKEINTNIKANSRVCNDLLKKEEEYLMNEAKKEDLLVEFMEEFKKGFNYRKIKLRL